MLIFFSINYQIIPPPDADGTAVGDDLEGGGAGGRADLPPDEERIQAEQKYQGTLVFFPHQQRNTGE